MRFVPFWFDQAISTADISSAVELKSNITTDICIIGGGFTGLWSAIQLKLQEPDKHVVVIDKGLCGQGASGRNGGAMLTWSTKFLSLANLYGTQSAIKLVKQSEQAVYDIQTFCNTHKISCELRVDGAYYTASNKAQINALSPVISQLDKHNINQWHAIHKDAIHEKTGSKENLQANYSQAAGSIQPAKLVRGLKSVAQKLGVKVYENTKMTSLVEGEPATINVPNGRVLANKIIVAVNAWLPKLFEQFSNKVVLVSSDMIITKPMPKILNKLGLNHGAPVIDSRIFVNYYRTTEDGRLMLGKGGNYFSYNNIVRDKFDQHSAYKTILNQSLAHFFKEHNFEIERTWTGPSDRSVTGFPFFGLMPNSQNIFYGAGYSGNGIVQSYLGGKILASLALGKTDQWSHHPMVDNQLASFPPEPFRTPGAFIVRNGIRRKERAEDKGHSVSRFDNWLAKFSGSAAKVDMS